MWFNFSNFSTSWKGVEFIKRLQSWDIGRAQTSAPYFKNLSDNVSMLAAADGFKPFRILNVFSGDVSESWKFKSFGTALVS